MDFIEMSPDSVNNAGERETLKMITGAGDSSVKLWSDSTLETQV